MRELALGLPDWLEALLSLIGLLCVVASSTLVVVCCWPARLPLRRRRAQRPARPRCHDCGGPVYDGTRFRLVGADALLEVALCPGCELWRLDIDHWGVEPPRRPRHHRLREVA